MIVLNIKNKSDVKLRKTSNRTSGIILDNLALSAFATALLLTSYCMVKWCEEASTFLIQPPILSSIGDQGPPDRAVQSTKTAAYTAEIQSQEQIYGVSNVVTTKGDVAKRPIERVGFSLTEVVREIFLIVFLQSVCIPLLSKVVFVPIRRVGLVVHRISRMRILFAPVNRMRLPAVIMPFMRLFQRRAASLWAMLVKVYSKTGLSKIVSRSKRIVKTFREKGKKEESDD